MKKFSGLDREKLLTSLEQSTDTDILIIGGGITGAGIALDAASRGLKVGLIEASDFASGTSSRSTKLIHGGLRYLANLEFGIVASTGRERAILYKNAPHLVYPQKMLLPIVKGGSLKKFPVYLALWMYDLLAGVKSAEKKQAHSLAETTLMEPLLSAKNIKSALSYYEYKSSDSRLVIEVLKKAVEMEAKPVNYSKVTDFVYENGTVNGVKVIDVISNKEYTLKAKYIINAAGVWTDEVRGIDNPVSGKKLYITKGVHLVVSMDTLPLKHAIYFDTDDGRMMFAIPKTDVVYIGTTDTPYEGNLSEPDVSLEDLDYVLRNTNRMFPHINLTQKDVISKWSGLRPLIYEEGKSPSEMSREDEIFISPSGLISITGGKLTGYRLMAKKIVNIVGKNMKKSGNRDIGDCKTLRLRLSGAFFNKNFTKAEIIEFADTAYDEAKQVAIKPEDFKRLVYRYGTNVKEVTERAFELYNESKDSNSAWVLAEIDYVLDNEMMLTLEDFMIRRTEMALFEPLKAEALKSIVEKRITDYFNKNNN